MPETLKKNRDFSLSIKQCMVKTVNLRNPILSTGPGQGLIRSLPFPTVNDY